TATDTPTPTRTPTATATPTPTPTSTPVEFTLRLQPGQDGYQGLADTTISRFDPDVNYADASLLSLQSVDGHRAYPLLQFDLSAIPQGADVRQAQLQLHITYRSGQAAATLQLYPLLRNWQPEFANWYLATQHSAWDQSGAEAAGRDYSATPSDSIALPAAEIITLDVTNDIGRWLRGDANRGWILRLQSGVALNINLASAESADPNLRPQLLITLATDTQLATPTPTATPPATPTPSGASGSSTFHTSLRRGWNALSIPLIPANPALPPVLDSIIDQVESVWWYDNSSSPARWRHYRPNDPASDLFAIPQLLGVWIQMNADAELSVFGLRPTSTVIHLEPGWNQIGFPAAAPQPVESTLAAIAGRYDRVYVWDNVSELWQVYIPGDRNNSLREFHPGDAIWIHAIQAANLIIIN
ncbi:MAG: DNRLRE domain-containing protein, partial [Chloroflexi bacterium]|nr:DNRLRE domain-containing protein [Chloroflexota bacterium]